MKTKLLKHVTFTFLFSFPFFIFGQSIDLGTAADYALFTTNGAIINNGSSQILGNVGTDNGTNSGFGNINGQLYEANYITGEGSTDLLSAYQELNDAVPTSSPSSYLGNGQTLMSGVYAISSSATLNGELTFDANGDTNTVFIIQINGSLSTTANSSVKLINGAQACRVFWKVEGLVDLAAGTFMRGNIVANNSPINLHTNVHIEGRALSIAGAITVERAFVNIPIGCGNLMLTGPEAPDLGAMICYNLFTAKGSMTDTGTTKLTGDVGTNDGVTSGFNPLLVTGEIHTNPDVSTSNCAADLLIVDTYLNTLNADVLLMYPADFGKNLALTPRTYVLNDETILTDTLYFDATGNQNAVFVIKIFGSLETIAHSKVILLNGAQAKNIYWEVNGTVTMNDFSEFAGILVSNNGTINLKKGVSINGKVFTTNGDFTTDSVQVTMATNCGHLGLSEQIKEDVVQIYPNPFTNEIHIQLATSTNEVHELKIYTILGEEIIRSVLENSTTTIVTTDLPTGVYFYQVTNNNQVVQSGKLVSRR
jgi:hypothetical protein